MGSFLTRMNIQRRSKKVHDYHVELNQFDSSSFPTNFSYQPWINLNSNQPMMNIQNFPVTFPPSTIFPLDTNRFMNHLPTTIIEPKIEENFDFFSNQRTMIIDDRTSKKVHFDLDTSRRTDSRHVPSHKRRRTNKVSHGQVLTVIPHLSKIEAKAIYVAIDHGATLAERGQRKASNCPPVEPMKNLHRKSTNSSNQRLELLFNETLSNNRTRSSTSFDSKIKPNEHFRSKVHTDRTRVRQKSDRQRIC